MAPLLVQQAAGLLCSATAEAGILQLEASAPPREPWQSLDAGAPTIDAARNDTGGVNGTDDPPGHQLQEALKISYLVNKSLALLLVPPSCVWRARAWLHVAARAFTHCCRWSGVAMGLGLGLKVPGVSRRSRDFSRKA